MTGERDFEGKTVLITGGTRGIGRATALLLARRGASLALNYLRNSRAAEEAKAEVEAAGARCVLLKGNVGEAEALGRVFAEAGAAFGGLDGFVSNAIFGVARPVLDLTERGFDVTLSSTAKAFLLGAQHAARLMEGRPGAAMVGMTSYGTFRTLDGYAAVGAGKAAMATLARYLARELGPRGIRVNCVSGGPVETQAVRSLPNWEEFLRETAARTPLGRAAQPEDLARVVAWLLSPESGWVTGQTILADGGLTLA